MLISQLGDAAFAKREQASKMMLTFGTAAKPHLEEAARDSDPEVSTRAAALLAAIRMRAAKSESALIAAIRLRVAKREAWESPTVLTMALPVDVAERNECLGMFGETLIGPNGTPPEIRLSLSPAPDESYPTQLPLFLVIADRFWHPVPIWIGPRMVRIPAEEQPPLQPALDLVDYDLIAELDNRWEPTTPKAKARVQAVARYLSKGGQLQEGMLPPVPIPAWVDVLRLRLAQGDTTALAGLSRMDAAPSAEELLRLLKDAKGPARALILDCLATVDLKPHGSAVRSLLNGHYQNDAPLLGMLVTAGVKIEPAKLKYTAAKIVEADNHSGYSLLRYCSSAGIKAPDGLVDVLLQKEWIGESSLCLLPNLLSESQKDSLRKRLLDRVMSDRERFHARCLLFLNGDKEQEEHLLKFVPPGTPFITRYYSERPDEYPVVILNQFASYGLFPARTEMLLQQDLFQTNKIGPSVSSMLHWNATPAQKAEVLRKMSKESDGEMMGLLAVWGCREVVPRIVESLDAMEFTEKTQETFNRMVDNLRVLADPRSGPCLVRALEKVEKTALHYTPETRMTALEALLRIGADFPDGKKTMLREIANERRFSVFRMVALAGLARVSPEEGLAQMLKEVEAAPPVALPALLDWLAATRLTGALPVLRRHLKHRYEPAALSAAVGMVRLGDGESLPVIKRLIRRNSGWPLYPHRSLLSYWKPDTPPEQVKMIRECLEADAPGLLQKPCVTRDDYCQEFCYYRE